MSQANFHHETISPFPPYPLIMFDEIKDPNAGIEPAVAMFPTSIKQLKNGLSSIGGNPCPYHNLVQRLGIQLTPRQTFSSACTGYYIIWDDDLEYSRVVIQGIPAYLLETCWYIVLL
jgi:hypothetical protein